MPFDWALEQNPDLHALSQRYVGLSRLVAFHNASSRFTVAKSDVGDLNVLLSYNFTLILHCEFEFCPVPRSRDRLEKFLTRLDARMGAKRNAWPRS